MYYLRKILSVGVFIYCFQCSYAQRVYKPASVLAVGNWYKMAVTSAGVYKLDVPFLNALGITGSIPTSQIRIYGNGGGMLSERNASPRIDDLEENSIWVEDGGDGVLNGNDFILFFSNGPHEWEKDSINKRFTHKKNLYSEKAFYYITIGGTGKRITTQSPQPIASSTVTAYDERYFHELDSVNFLSSGKEWFGEEFSSLPGRSLSRTFPLPFSDIQPGLSATIKSNVAARSFNAPARYLVSVNNQQVQQLDVPAISTNQYDVFARQSEKVDNFTLPLSTASVTFTYTQGGTNSQGWLNWFEAFCRRALSFPTAKNFQFRDWSSVGNLFAEFVITNADATSVVWDVTDPFHPVKMNGVLSGTQFRFRNDAQRLREYVAFSNVYLTPQVVGRVPNQNLHATTATDYFIITHPQFLSQAIRLSQFHQQRNNLKTVVVTTDQVFNEFSSGTPDPTAIRDFIKMYFDKYGSTWAQRGKYLMLFGKASFDYKDRISNNTNYVPCYESPASLDPLSTYTSDDFFGFLEDAEDINSNIIINTLDIGIGRLPGKTIEEAKNFIDKVYDYHSQEAFGSWRNNSNFIADDEDQNLHLQDAEVLTKTVESTAPVFNIEKIYLDAYRQESGSAGGRYPDVVSAINNQIHAGTLIWNYSGHGGPERLADEVILDQSIINTWKNRFRLPLFITATCDFAPYDIPTVNSIGENLVVRPQTGAIALMTTTRVVFANSNRIINDNYLRIALLPDAAGIYKSLGEAVQAAKNFTYQTSGDITNNRKFALLGDPAMTLAFPQMKVNLTTINGRPISGGGDTLKATDLVTMAGDVLDQQNNLLSNFTGTVFLTLFDKPYVVTTLANDASSLPVSISQQNNILFRGKASVEMGKFSLQFRIPKNINYQYGKGKISLYAHDEKTDGNGFNQSITIGGIGNSADNDKTGPEIKAYLNDNKFVNGSITNTAPLLIVNLSDSSGINTGSSGIEYDITATLDNNPRIYYVLNNFFEAELNDFRKGEVRFQLPELSPGNHSLKIKAWDVLNNSNEYVLHFTVVNTEELRLDHVLNYPNPFSTKTNFWFEHNQPGVDLHTKIEIFTVSGKLLKTIAQTINTAGNRSNVIEWNGTDEYGSKIGRGVYLYRLKVKSANGPTAEKWERLVLLQ